MSTQPDDTRAFADLPKTEQTILETLAASGPLARTAIADVFAEDTEWSPQTVGSAGPRLQDRGLVETRPNPAYPVEHIYELTERGQAWVRNGGDAA